MTGDRIFNVIGAIIAVAMVTTIVGHPRTAAVVRSIGSAGTGFLATAMGRATPGRAATLRQR